MERLTKIGGPLNQCYMQCKSNCGTCKHVDIALRRLIEYEDTGLTPEEIRADNEVYKAYRYVCGGKPPEEIEKALALLKAEEQGLLIKLPCKVGDTVLYKDEYSEFDFKVDKIWIDDEIRIFGGNRGCVAYARHFDKYCTLKGGSL